MTSRYIFALLTAAAMIAAARPDATRHTYYSLFSRSDSLQVDRIFSPGGNEFKTVGHHGPAVENKYMALRFYFDSRGAIDVYSKSGRIDGELGRWLWYPPVEAQTNDGAGCDEYYVGKTLGLGGVRLWNGKEEIRLKTGAGRLCKVGRTDDGAFMEMISYRVAYQEDTIDLSVRVDVFESDRWATLTVKELSGKPLRFVTGVNYHPGSEVRKGDGWTAVWGEHPADVSGNPAPIGGALRFDSSEFPETEDTGSYIRLISVPLSSFSTRIAAASVKEDELNTAERFFAFVSQL